MVIQAILYGLFGLIIGSFLNVVILRRGARSLGGRSGCMACGAQLQWYDMVPVVSWIVLRGQCRTCYARISIQYPLVEALTAGLFVFVGVAPMGLLEKGIGLCIVAFLVIIAAYDIRHTIIPDEWAYAFAALAFLYSFIIYVQGAGDASIVMMVLAGPFAAFPLFALWAVSQGRWMGLGDPKLALGIGWLLGASLGLYAVFLAFVIGAVVSICILLPFAYLRQRVGITRLSAARMRFTMKSEVPFGPFLIASCVLVWSAVLYGVPLPFFL